MKNIGLECIFLSLVPDAKFAYLTCDRNVILTEALEFKASHTVKTNSHLLTTTPLQHSNLSSGIQHSF